MATTRAQECAVAILDNHGGSVKNAAHFSFSGGGWSGFGVDLF
jgi:hypothetical protein